MRYLNPRLSYYYFWLVKMEGLPYWNSTSGFNFDLLIALGRVFCIGVPNFDPNPSKHSGVMTSYRFCTMAGGRHRWILHG